MPVAGGTSALEASGGGRANSASNAPVFQIQRIDNEQMRFIAMDPNTHFSDTAFSGSAAAVTGDAGRRDSSVHRAVHEHCFLWLARHVFGRCDECVEHVGGDGGDGAQCG